MNYLTQDEIVQDLKENLSTEDKANLKAFEFDSLIMLHHGFGTHIRNKYGLWHDENPYTNHDDPNGPLHADQFSFIIIQKLWQALKDEDAGIQDANPDLEKNM